MAAGLLGEGAAASRRGRGSPCLPEISPHPQPPNLLTGVMDRARGKMEWTWLLSGCLEGTIQLVLNINFMAAWGGDSR